MSLAEAKRRTRRQALDRRLKAAEAKVRRAQAEVQSVRNEIMEMEVNHDLETIRSWRGDIDWRALMNRQRSDRMRMLCDHMFDRLGLGVAPGIWADTGGVVLVVRVSPGSERSDAAAQVAHVEESVRMLLPFLDLRPDGLVWFGIQGKDVDDLDQLRIAPDLSEIHLDRLVFGNLNPEDRVSFATLGEALIHLQTTHPLVDFDNVHGWRRPEHVPGLNGDALREAMKAYVDGCGIAGAPLGDGPTVSGVLR